MGVKKVKSWAKEQGDHVIIEEEDFDPKIHEEYVEPSAEAGKDEDRADDTQKRRK